MERRDGYGTISDVQSNGVAADAIDQERAALLSKPDEREHFAARLGRHMRADVSNSWADIALLSCYIVTGLLDSSAVFIWGAFVSMQTGNTIYLGLGLVEPYESSRWIKSCISIGCFCLGSFFFSNFHRRFGSPRKRWVIVSSYSIQMTMIFVAALMVTLGPKMSKTDPVDVWVGLPLALLAFQSSGQAVMSRVLQYGPLTSVVLTTIYCDLFSDQKLFVGITGNVERNRRAAAPVLLLVGAILGGIWAHSGFGLAGALWTAVVLKFFLIVAFVFWPADSEDSD